MLQLFSKGLFMSQDLVVSEDRTRKNGFKLQISHLYSLVL